MANIEATYKTSMQTSQSASNMYQQVVKNITDIVNNPDLDQTAKDAAIAIQTGMLDDSLSAFNAIGQTGIGSTVNFNPQPTTTPSPATTAENRNAVVGLYQNILGREPEDSGLAYWLRELDTGHMTLAAVRQAIYDSEEFANLVRP